MVKYKYDCVVLYNGGIDMTPEELIGKTIKNVTRVGYGMCNIAFCIEFTDGTSATFAGEHDENTIIVCCDELDGESRIVVTEKDLERSQCGGGGGCDSDDIYKSGRLIDVERDSTDNRPWWKFW